MAKIVSLSERWRCIICGRSASVLVYGIGGTTDYVSHEHAIYDGWRYLSPFQQICPYDTGVPALLVALLEYGVR